MRRWDGGLQHLEFRETQKAHLAAISCCVCHSLAPLPLEDGKDASELLSADPRTEPPPPR